MFRTLVDRILVKLPTRTALNFEFFYYHHRLPNLDNPITLNERILHRKMFDRDPRLPQLSDKILAKEYVANLLGDEWVVPTIWEGTCLPARNERNWPIPYVLKASHGCGWNYFVRTQEDQKWDEIERVAAEWLGTKFGKSTHEWAYSVIEPRLLVEPYLDDIANTPTDYKFFVFAGRVEYIQVDTSRFKNHKQYFYDRQWKRQDIEHAAPGTVEDIPPPVSLEKLISGAEQLAAPFPFVRVDLYDINGSPRFGEMTFYPNAARIGFKPKGTDHKLGRLWPSKNPLDSI